MQYAVCKLLPLGAIAARASTAHSRPDLSALSIQLLGSIGLGDPVGFMPWMCQHCCNLGDSSRIAKTVLWSEDVDSCARKASELEGSWAAPARFKAETGQYLVSLLVCSACANSIDLARAIADEGSEENAKEDADLEAAIAASLKSIDPGDNQGDAADAAGSLEAGQSIGLGDKDADLEAAIAASLKPTDLGDQNDAEIQAALEASLLDF